MRHVNTRQILTLAACMAVVAGSAGVARAQVPGEITKKGTGQRLQGFIKWRAASKVYEIKPQGRDVVTTVPLRQVANVRIARAPDGLEEAARKVQGGAYKGEHIATLEAIVDQYLMLQYDMVAGRWLAEAYVKSGQAAAAYPVCARIIDNREMSQVDPDFVKVYWDVLIETEKFAKLREMLTWGIEQGPPEVAAVAQISRGKMSMKRKEYRDALVDGFLRTILLFSSVKHVQAEALYNAAICFDELGEGPNAAKMRKKLLAEYPDTEYSRKVQSGS